ncbi:SAM-dependent methyltransferase [Halapricum hydrolyticum]|uniref:Methyltransferase domain-containing protein n=1 Tax=Halapricum hydrolyticum TaxID=2979991 RepID=A0AAE3ICK5_9EURY|nr:methyltransferase domain-containing protein [Halapricum hydrolyticum]MCU4718682.1 methyltransferase domain-containing protein [Halapricum hydrolyticum]MCU4727632.1 methyltransferase domain-containing protein [Halapricum hydrolyticum]
MTVRVFEIAEADRRIQNPFSREKLSLLADVCDVSEGTTMLDLACGKGELLCQWAAQHGVSGTGVDVHDAFVSDARDRATELDVAEQLTFIEADASEYEVADHEVDVASCLGASWIGGGFQGTLQLLSRATRDESSLVLVGEPYWREEPPPGAVEACADGDSERFGTLATLQQRAEDVGFELVEMVLANADTWDRYEATQWKTVSDWLREHPDDPDADAVREHRDDSRRNYLEYGRRYFGWGVFVFREKRD